MPRPCRLPTCCLTTEYSKTQQFCSLYITIHWKKYFKYPYHHLKSGPRSSYRPGFGPLFHVGTIKDTANTLGATGSSGNSYYEIKSQVFQRQLGGFCGIPCYTVPFIWYCNVILSLPRMGTLLPYNAFISHTSVSELVDKVHVGRTRPIQDFQLAKHIQVPIETRPDNIFNIVSIKYCRPDFVHMTHAFLKAFSLLMILILMPNSIHLG